MGPTPHQAVARLPGRGAVGGGGGAWQPLARLWAELRGGGQMLLLTGSWKRQSIILVSHCWDSHRHVHSTACRAVMCVCHARARPAACTPACGPATPQPGTPCRRTAASCSLYTATAARRLLHPRARGARSGGTAAATHPRRSDPPPHGLLHLGCERLCCPVQSLALLPGLYEGGGRADGMLMVAQQAAVEPQWNPGSVARCCAHARTSLQQAAAEAVPCLALKPRAVGCKRQAGAPQLVVPPLPGRHHLRGEEGRRASRRGGSSCTAHGQTRQAPVGFAGP